MDPKDFPKKYGGQLDWDWGSIPHLDAETREALERDGNKGWARGPALWLDHKRVLVGSENGKLRRSDAEITSMKPVVYAADGTAEPVHPHAKDTLAMNGALKATNGSIVLPPIEHKTSSHAITAAQAASATAAATTAAVTAEVAKRQKSDAAQSASLERVPTNPDSAAAAGAAMGTSAAKAPSPLIHKENIRAAPMDGAQVHLPTQQPGFPEKTAEYISESNTPTTNGTPTAPAPAPAAVLVAAAARPTTPQTKSPITASSTSSVHNSPHPPSQPLPGPHSKHETEVTKAIAHRMEGESISSISANMNGSANGDIPHPEVIVSSDRSKGLAVEADKLGGLRPGMERFVTAAEVPATAQA